MVIFSPLLVKDIFTAADREEKMECDLSLVYMSSKLQVVIKSSRIYEVRSISDINHMCIVYKQPENNAICITSQY